MTEHSKSGHAALRIRAARETRGLTQQGLADESGVSARTISRIETSATSPRISTLTRIAEALGEDWRHIV